MINYFCHYLYISGKHYFVKKFIFTRVWERYSFKIESSTFLLTHSMERRVFLEKLTGFQLDKKFPAFYGLQMFITSLNCARHLSPSWAISIRSMPPHLTSWRPILILSPPSTPGPSKLSLSFGFPHQNPIYTPTLPKRCYMPRPLQSSSFDHPRNIGWAQIIKLLIT